MAFDPTRAGMKLLQEMRNLLQNILDKIGGGGGTPAGVAGTSGTGGSPQPNQPNQPQQNFGDILSGGLNRILENLGAKLGISPQHVAAKRELEKAQEVYETQQADLVQKMDEARRAADLFNDAQRKAAEAANNLAQAEVAAQQRMAQGPVPDVSQLNDQLDALRANLAQTNQEAQAANQRRAQASAQAQQASQQAAQASSQLSAAKATYAATPEGIDWKKMSEGLGQAGGFAESIFGQKKTGNFAEALNQGDITGIVEGGANIAKLTGEALGGDPQAMMELVKQGIELIKANFEAIIDHMKDLGRQADKYMTSDKLEDELGAASEGAKDVAGSTVRLFGAVGGPLAELQMKLNPVVLFMDTLVGSIAVLRRWNDAIHQSNMRFAEFSASMSMVQARAEFRRVMLEQERGERRAGTAEYFEQGRILTERRLALWEDSFANFKNILMGGINHGVAYLLEITGIVPLIEKFLEAFNDQFGGGGPGFSGPAEAEAEREAGARWGNNPPAHWKR